MTTERIVRPESSEHAREVSRRTVEAFERLEQMHRRHRLIGLVCWLLVVVAVCCLTFAGVSFVFFRDANTAVDASQTGLIALLAFSMLRLTVRIGEVDRRRRLE